MAKVSKRMQQVKSAVEPGKTYSVEQAFTLLKQLTKVNFTESVDASVNLGIDARKSEQTVRGSTVLPKGTGKKIKVAVFAQGDKAKDAEQAGADIVGFEDLSESIKGGNIDFDVLVATPDSMRLVGQLGQILGPRGLMPNPKVGTVTNDVAKAVENAKAGQVQYRNDKGGIIHCRIGDVNFDEQDLKENLEALVQDLKKRKPSTSKGIYLKKVAVSSTMGPGINVDISSLQV